MQVKPIKHARGAATRQAILDAAEEVFANVGFGAARLEDVALAVGIRRPSITYYFASKQDLYDAVESSIFDAMHEAALEGMEGAATHMDRLLGLLDGWLDFQIRRPTAARIILRLVADVAPRHGNPTEFSALLLEDLEEVVVGGIAAGEFRAVSPMLLINAVASSTLFYVCNGEQIGEGRHYDPADPVLLREYRATLHQIARSVVGMAPISAGEEVVSVIPEDADDEAAVQSEDGRRIARWAQILREGSLPSED